jgi:hypothetical protein
MPPRLCFWDHVTVASYRQSLVSAAGPSLARPLEREAPSPAENLAGGWRGERKET